MHSIQPAIAELERMYSHFKPLFPAGIPGNDPVSVIQKGSKGSRPSSSAGWLAEHVWKDGPNREMNEITLCAEHLARPVEDIAATLFHQMVHHYNAIRGVRECSSPRRYHNHLFREMATAVGLIVERDGTRGRASSRLGARARTRFCSLNFKERPIALFRRENATNKARPKLLKWSCGCTNVWCATKLQASWKQCKQGFRPRREAWGQG